MVWTSQGSGAAQAKQETEEGLMIQELVMDTLGVFCWTWLTLRSEKRASQDDAVEYVYNVKKFWLENVYRRVVAW